MSKILASNPSTKAVTFKPSETMPRASLGAQKIEVQAWCAANPTAIIRVLNIPDGGLPPYVRKQEGKRAECNRLLTQGLTPAMYNLAARAYGGGWTDLIAAVLGGYSPTAPGFGTPAVAIVAKA